MILTGNLLPALYIAQAESLTSHGVLQEHILTIKQGSAASETTEAAGSQGPAPLPAGIGADPELTFGMGSSSQGFIHAMPEALDDEVVRERLLSRKTPTWSGRHAAPLWDPDHDLWRPRGICHLLAHR